MRTLVIGDIHGNAKGLQQVLDKANVTNEDKIIQLGDVADGWGETYECVDILLDIQKNAKDGNKPIFIRGNHCVWLHDWLYIGEQPLIWVQQGGKATIKSYIENEGILNKSHKEFFKNQKDYYIDDESRIFIHGGWDYKSDKFPTSANYSVNAGSIAKECHWDRSLLQGAKSSVIQRKSFKALDDFKEVYIGHTANSNAKISNYGKLWNLDSGSGWYGRLAIMDIDTKEVWYSDYSKDLYPNEKGR